MKRFLSLVICIYFLHSNTSAQLKLPSIFGDQMVLQQKSQVALWGWAPHGTKISFKGSWPKGKASVEVDSTGKWSTKLLTAEAGGPYELTIKATLKSKKGPSLDTTIVFEDVLLGEVWLCSGQSNMVWPLNRSENGETEIGKANHPNIRFFKSKRTHASDPLDDNSGQWNTCSSSTAAEFSAVAYHFGKYVQDQLDIPVGLIQVAWGGTPIEAWMRQESIASMSEFVKEKAIADSLAQAKGVLDETPPHKQHSVLYNGMIHPLVTYGIKGAIWYQGESNTKHPKYYKDLFTSMIKDWRLRWNIGDFPFLYVQIAPFKYNDDTQASLIREAQSQTLALRNTGMAVTMDIGNPDDIHPQNKAEVGRRLGLWAMHQAYGYRDIPCSGPIFQNMRVIQNKVMLYFDYTYTGLEAKNDTLIHFELAGKDKIFHPAKATIQGASILLQSESVPDPIAVRYAWKNDAQPNLFNSEGLPASPFRSDRW